MQTNSGIITSFLMSLRYTDLKQFRKKTTLQVVINFANKDLL